MRYRAAKSQRRSKKKSAVVGRDEDSEERRMMDDEARVVAMQMHLQRVALRPNSLPFPLAVGDVNV